MLEGLLWDAHLDIRLVVVEVEHHEQGVLFVFADIGIVFVLVEAFCLCIYQVLHLALCDGFFGAC